MDAFASLPSIYDPNSYPQLTVPGNGYPPDLPRALPNIVNDFPSPDQQGLPQQQPPYLPPLQPQTDPGSLAYPPSDQRGGYYKNHLPPRPGYRQEPYSSDTYYDCDYRDHLASFVYEYPPGGAGAAPQLTQAAPRQRASIACNYCRRRKIRCSGFESAPGAKCQNCARMNQECIFQPVSSSDSTAFIPVSVVSGGVPPGTQLLGAYGQPLAPSSVPGPHPQGPYPQHPSGAPPPDNCYPLVQSPTKSFLSYGDARTDDGSQVAGRRRRRTSEEQDEGYRLPPPRAPVEEDRQRSSLAEFLNHSSLDAAPSSRSSTRRNDSSGASTPPQQQGQSFSQKTKRGNSSVMSLDNLLEKNDMDKTMINRPNWPNPSPYQNGRRDASR